MSRLCLSVRGARPSFVPTLELLEGRDCPAAPVINTFTAVQASGSQVVLSGTITDENPLTVCMAFTGAATGSASVNANGQFSVTVALASIDEVHATATDENNLSSDTLTVTPANSPPIVTLEAILAEGPGNIWTFRGRVNDEFPAGLTVYLNDLAGLDNQPVTVDADGYYFFQTSLAAGTEGTVTATVLDPWGGIGIAYAVVRP